MKKRLRRLEARLPPAPEEDSPLDGLWMFLTGDELARLVDAFRCGWPIPLDELERVVLRAYNRRAAGLSEADVIARSYGADDVVADAFWRFCMAVGGRHGYASDAASFTRYQLDRLTLADVYRLVGLVSDATPTEKLDAAAPIIEKLWFDGTPLSVPQFADLALRGICPPATVPKATMPTDGQ